MAAFLGSCFFGVILSYIAEKKNKIFPAIAIAFILSIICGFRSITTGTDTQSYYLYFSSIANGNTGLFEIGFEKLVYLLIKIFHSVQIAIFIISLLTNSFLIMRLWDIREKCSFALMVFVYITLLYPQSFNIIRQYLAAALVFWAMRYLERNKYLIYVIYILIATLIHTSAIISLGILYIHITNNLKTNSRKRIVFVIGGFIAICMISIHMYSAIINEYGNYFSNATHAQVNLFTVLYVVIVLSYIHTIKGYSYETDVSHNVYYARLCLIGLLLSTIGFVMPQAGRLGLYYSIFEIPVFSMAMKDNKYSLFYRFFLISMAMYTIIVKVTINGESGIIPYEFIIY